MISRKNPIDLLAPILLLILCAGTFWQAGCSPQSKPPQKITIGSNIIGMNALLYIAKNQGYDQEQDLEITIQPFEAGRDAVRELRAGRLDLACCSEFVLVNEVFAGSGNLRCLAVLSSGDIHSLIARRDKAISRPADLKGKTIGVPKATSGEFFLGRFLSFNNIAPEEVTLVDLNPFDLAGALAAGRVDAVLAWEPLGYDIIKQVGNNAIEWPAQEGQDFYWLLVSRKDVIKNKRPDLEKLLRALFQAAKFAQEQPEAAMAIIAQWTKVPLADLQAGKYPKRYKLFLDQGLLLAMEDQARWMIRNHLTGQTRVPNYLGYMQVGALYQVNPQAVRLFVPKDQDK
jgi:NitT/TauT family transport system substrate-binding protein